MRNYVNGKHWAIVCAAFVFHVALERCIASETDEIRQLGVLPGETITVKAHFRPLDIPVVGSPVQKLTDNTASHVQLVAYDSGGIVRDNFGLTGNTLSTTEPASILREDNSNISKNYDTKSLGEWRMPVETYVRARNATITSAEQARYSLANNVPAAANAAQEVVFGYASEGVAKATKAVFSSGNKSLNDFDTEGRRNPMVVSDTGKQMSFPGYNCMYLPIVFEQFGKGFAGFQTVVEYRQPGEILVQENGIVRTDSGLVNLQNISGLGQQQLNGTDWSGALKSLADLLETGEEIVEVREDMREDRRERKAREQAERERKAAEEAERLRQQQIAAQRRKAQSEQKKSKSSGAEVARRPTPTTQQNRPAGTKPATETGTEPTDTGSQTSTTPPAQTTVRIDFTPLDNCTSILNSSRNLIGSLAASMVEVAMSDGEKAYSKLKSQIASLPDGDRKQQLEQTLESKYAAFKAAKSYYE